MIDLSRFTVLTFDCYGTLINWEAGILAALRPILRRHGHDLPDAELLSLYAELEPEAEQALYRPYREVLRHTVQLIGKRLRFTPSLEEAASLADSLTSWRPFADVVPALRRLKSKYRLGVISNIDDDLFAGSAQLLGVPFDWVITAEQARSYKPSFAIFKLALERIGAPREQVLHVAESLFHDVAPAQQLGLATVWVDRRGGRGKAAASREADVQPDLIVPDLMELTRLLAPAVRAKAD